MTGTCGNIVETKTGVLTITSDSLLNSSRDVQVILNCQSAATISATPNPMNLQAEKSSSNADTLTIKNTGTSNLEVTGITSSDITWLTIPTTVIILAPGSSQTVNVTAACRGLIETRTGTLTIANNDPVNPRQVVNVSLQCYQGVVVTVKFAELYWTTPFGGVAAEPCNIAVAGWVIAVDVVSRVSDTGVGQLIVPNDGWAKGVDQVACAGVDAPMALAIKNARLYTSALLNMWKQHIKSSVTVVSEPRSFVYTHPNSIEGYLGTGGLPTPNTIDDGLVFLVDVLVPSP